MRADPVGADPGPRPRARLAAGVLLLAALAACGGQHAAAADESTRETERGAVEAPATVVGTTLDASTGKVLAGVRVEIMEGAYTLSDERGRFELRGLPAGQGGTLVGTTEDGRRRELTLRTLAPGRSLEVVLRLTRP